jgi:hypothetical protein
MQDRILGPLTMLQFVYAVVGGGLAYTTFMAVPSPFGPVLGIIVAMFTLAMVFLKINERPFSHFLSSLFAFMGKPRMRVWHREESGIEVEIYKNPSKQSSTHVEPKHITKEQMEKLAKTLDSPGSSALPR